MRVKRWKDYDGFKWREVIHSNKEKILKLKCKYENAGWKAWLEDWSAGHWILTGMKTHN